MVLKGVVSRAMVVALGFGGTLALTGMHPASADSFGGSPTAPVVGGSGGGDPYFPASGNGGIDVAHYDLLLRYDPPASPKKLVGKLSGTASITLTTTANLKSFNLDLDRAMKASSVTVNGAKATFSAKARELTIVPAKPLAKGSRATVVVKYAGLTGRPKDSEGSLFGWVTTKDGAMVASEVDGAPTWYPVNDTPRDKATYQVVVNVPKGRTAVSNGNLVGSVTAGNRTTWTWRADDPMASYLATVCVGDFDLTRSRTASGIPIIHAVDRKIDADTRARAKTTLARYPKMIAFYEKHFGKYPFSSAGLIIDDDRLADDGEFGYALETQTRPLLPAMATESVAAHELAHQWFGDAVSPFAWKDMWLNEGFATYAEWLWIDQATDDVQIPMTFETDNVMSNDDPAYWGFPLADPGRSRLFDRALYERGGTALYELRKVLGQAMFDKVLTTWVATHRGRTGTVAEFEKHASTVSGRNLTPFFKTWLHSTKRPPVK